MKSRITQIVLTLLSLQLAAGLTFGEETPPPAAPKSPPALTRPGDHSRTLVVSKEKRAYLVHVPKGYNPETPTPVVLALHGVGMNGPMMVLFSGLNKKSDEAGFIVVYPSGTGVGPFLKWNARGLKGDSAEGKADDVEFIGKLLDELAGLVNVDRRRVYATGLSNGGMMCYLLAAELSDRIAAIAPVAGRIVTEESEPKRPVSVIHFHGLKDDIVPFESPQGKTPSVIKVKGVEESIQTWVRLNGCNETPKSDTLSKADDEMKVTRKTFGGGKEDSEVVLIVIDEGGHTWPGQDPPVGFIGKSAKNISANDLLWEFFEKHPMKCNR
ncbi:MAG: family carbohydrate esterase [Planctomycetaceae bacterium]|nr:family carbohydrate esterase [Planctomycetaceae bacterium]